MASTLASAMNHCFLIQSPQPSVGLTACVQVHTLELYTFELFSFEHDEVILASSP